MMEDLISIITPVYNAEKFLSDTINTVLNQSYTNLELILVDDCSYDNSINVIKNIKDKRIKLIKNKINSKAAITRNNGIKKAKGRYICFLDADDLWDKEKLEKQVKFMKEKNCAFSFTGYEFADEKGRPNGKKVFIPERINYKQALKNTTIWTSTVMFDMDKLSKEDIYMPIVDRGQDTATWWKVLKKVDYAYGLNEILSFYRRTNNSLSSNKITALKRTWNLYRNVEHLNIISSFYNFTIYCFNAVKRRI
ncbi:MAG: glycosyltransferase family 2 protein [Bacilli bacterium]|nr:glycosyltransferase family 2 protein [Bacilli bacterium]